jgi:thiol-disulfide isomerase/thioredoxin
MVLLTVVFAILPARIVRAQKADPGAGPRPSPARSVAEQLGDRMLKGFKTAWPDPPESVAMLMDILAGSQLGPGEGWFKKAVAQTRYGWQVSKNRFDTNHDGRITPEEFAGPIADFSRLDRDHDGSLSASDFDFTPHALVPSPGAMLFMMADRDGNGKLTHAEFDAFFQAVDSGGQGFLSLADLQEAFTPPRRGRGSSGGPQGPTTFTLVKGLARQEIGSLQPGPGLGTVAPDFTLERVDGKGSITLAKQVGPKPVVLIFGNFTCGPFRMQAGNVEKLYERYKDRAEFVMVYVREAHPIDGWRMESNDRVEVSLAQPRSYEERVSVAQLCSSRLKLGMPMLVDTIEDTVGARYSGMPSRLYLIDHRGRIAYKSGRGPFGFKPAELEHSLLLLLRDEFPDLKPRDSTEKNASHPLATSLPTTTPARSKQP